MKINGKTPEEIRDGLAEINKHLAAVQYESRQACIKAEKLFGKKKPNLKIVQVMYEKTNRHNR